MKQAFGKLSTVVALVLMSIPAVVNAQQTAPAADTMTDG
jgi:hypothetical protein